MPDIRAFLRQDRFEDVSLDASITALAELLAR
jgi:hypothetical protein